ncbi:MAG: MFS transporter [Planctomycetota bacterium]|nr:MFS transporter [Planctomycetota bacterium]
MEAPPAADRFRRNALLLWGAQFISASGDALFLPCLAWLAGRTSEGESGVGFAVFLAFLPYLLLGPLAGAWVDRGDRRRIMIASDLLRAALLLTLPLLAGWWGGVDYALITAVGFLLATFSTPFLPARDALLPVLVGSRSLPRWNAVMQTSGQLAMVVGLALGGLLMSGLGGAGATETERVVRALQIDGATFVLSAALLALIVLPPGARMGAPRGHLLADAREGLTYAAKHPMVGGLLILTALNNLAIMGPAIVGAAVLVQDTFGLEPAHYAWFEAAMALGMVTGSVVLVARGRHLSMRKLLLWGMVLDGLTSLPFLWLPTYSGCLVMIALHGLFIPMIVVGRTTLVQRLVPPERHGKVFALVGITVIGMTALSAALSGWIAELTSPRVLFGLAGVFGAGSGVAGFVLWRFREEPAAEA